MEKRRPVPPLYMKICPLCHTRFDDNAAFCPQCHAMLEPYAEDEKEAEKLKAEQDNVPKSFWVSVAWICGFIAVVYVFYMFLYGGFG